MADPERSLAARTAPRTLAVLVAGAASGLAWWGVSLMLGAGSYGIVGTRPVTGAVAGAVTGMVVAWISAAFHRRFPVSAILWFSPLSVYLAVALYGLLIHLLRLAMNDFHPDQLRWAVGVQSVLGMWWGITLLLPVAVPVHLLAYATHRLLRKLVEAG